MPATVLGRIRAALTGSPVKIKAVELENPVHFVSKASPPRASLPEEPAPELNLEDYPHPKPAHVLGADTQITLGDQHGSAWKFLFILIREKVLTDIDEADYAQFVQYFKKSVDELTLADIQQFKKLLLKLKAHPEGVDRIRLIGDVVCDRGRLDLDTFYLFRRIKALGLPIEGLVGNHEVELFIAYDPISLSFAESSNLAPDQACSMYNTAKLLNKFPELKDDAREAIKSYQDNLKLLSYSLAPEGGISIFTHAPAGIETIKKIAEKFAIAFKAGTAIELARTIDAINNKANELGGVAKLYEFMREERSLEMRYKDLAVKQEEKLKEIASALDLSFSNWGNQSTAANGMVISMRATTLLKENKLSEPVKEMVKAFKSITHELDLLSEMKDQARERRHQNPLYFLIWNRRYEGLQRPAHYTSEPGKPTYSMRFVHGHHRGKDCPDSPHLCSLEDEFARGDFTRGSYGVLCLKELSSLAGAFVRAPQSKLRDLYKTIQMPSLDMALHEPLRARSPCSDPGVDSDSDTDPDPSLNISY